MHRVENKRIIDIGGSPGYVYSVFLDVELHSSVIDARNFSDEKILSMIESVHSYLPVSFVRTQNVISAIMKHYAQNGAFNVGLNSYQVDMPLSYISVGVALGDLIYGVNPEVTSGQTRMLISALNNGIIDRIILSGNNDLYLLDMYLKQSHANPRALARGLYDGWLALEMRDSTCKLTTPVEVMIQIPPWIVTLNE